MSTSDQELARRAGQVAAGACLLIVIVTSWQPSLRAAEASSSFTAEDRGYWAWQPCVRAAIPTVDNTAAHPIDAFLVERLSAAGISPAPEADRRTLIRRATYDLHGLPPTPEEVTQFEADSAPTLTSGWSTDCSLRRTMASIWPATGSTWCAMPTATASSPTTCAPMPCAHRDYVIQSFNDDAGIDRFMVEQLAGDELCPDDPQALVATGYLRLGPYEENGRDVADQRNNLLNDITDVTGQVFLGLTIGCARCHDHKYDPLPQADYFRLQAFFAALALVDDEPLATSAERPAFADKQAAWKTATAPVREYIAAPKRRIGRRSWPRSAAIFPITCRRSSTCRPQAGRPSKPKWSSWHRGKWSSNRTMSPNAWTRPSATSTPRCANGCAKSMAHRRRRCRWPRSGATLCGRPPSR